MKKPDKPTRVLAMLAFCHQCLGAYADGIQDCQNVTCPIYPWMPRGKLEPDLEWLDYNPRKKGLVRWEDCVTNMTDEQRQAAAERLRRARDTKDDSELAEKHFARMMRQINEI